MRTLAGAALLFVVLTQAAEAKSFNVRRSGEAKLTFVASAQGTSWDRSGRESALLNVRVDGRWVADVVTFAGAEPFRYETALGPLRRGRHRVTLAVDREKSPVPKARVGQLRLSTTSSLVARHAPILYGRDLPEIPGRYENVRTDVPLLAYHTASTAGGQTTIEYTVIWSNEDGGTNTPALMARWGRTTDIEWIYRVVLDANGDLVSAVYQAPNHDTLPFTGAHEGDHPLLQTATANNNLLPVTDPRVSSGYRFFLDSSQTLAAGRARESVMDANPWTYQVMAKEAVHGTPDWSIQRDDPAATTVERPPGIDAGDVEAVKAVAVPVGTPPAGWRIDVRSLNRGFFLGTDYTAGPSFLNWRGDAVLTEAQPEAVLWTRN
jgi:hypothetical protein